MSEAIKVSYNGVEITYSEGENQWLFELRGRSRKAESLQKAKEAIDKPVQQKAGTEFKRCKAWLMRYGKWHKVDVTSYAGVSYRTDHWWVSDGGERSKAGCLYQDTPENAAIVEEFHKIDAELERLARLKAELCEKLTRLQPPAPEE